MAQVTEQLALLRSAVYETLSCRNYQTAMFLADKLISLGSFSSEDVHSLALSCFHASQYRRALSTLSEHGLIELETSSGHKPADATPALVSRCKLIAAECLTKLEEWDQCTEILGMDRISLQPTHFRQQSPQRDAVEAAMCCVRAKVCEALENPEVAISWYKQAALCDPLCAEVCLLLIIFLKV